VEASRQAGAQRGGGGQGAAVTVGATQLPFTKPLWLGPESWLGGYRIL